MNIIVGNNRRGHPHLRAVLPQFPPGYPYGRILRINDVPSQDLVDFARDALCPYRQAVHASIFYGVTRYSVIGQNFVLPDVNMYHTQLPVAVTNGEPQMLDVWAYEGRIPEAQLNEYFEEVPEVPVFEAPITAAQQEQIDSVNRIRALASFQVFLVLPKGLFPRVQVNDLTQIGLAIHEITADYELERQVARTAPVVLMNPTWCQKISQFIIIGSPNNQFRLNLPPTPLIPTSIIGLLTKIPCLHALLQDRTPFTPDLFILDDSVCNYMIPYMKNFSDLHMQGNLEASIAADYMLVLAVMWAVVKNTKVENFSTTLNRRFESLVRIADLPQSSVIFPPNWVNTYRSVAPHFKQVMLRYAREFFSAKAANESEVHYRMRSYMATMLGGHEMAGFSAMADFMDTSDRRQAHVSLHVLKDMVKFDEVRTKIENQCKEENIPLMAYKIMHPTTTELVNSQFPDLHFCAVEWKRITIATWADFADFSAQNPRAAELKRRVREKLDLPNMMVISQEFQPLIKKMGIPIDDQGEVMTQQYMERKERMDLGGLNRFFPRR